MKSISNIWIFVIRVKILFTTLSVLFLGSFITFPRVFETRDLTTYFYVIVCTKHKLTLCPVFYRAGGTFIIIIWRSLIASWKLASLSDNILINGEERNNEAACSLLHVSLQFGIVFDE